MSCLLFVCCLLLYICSRFSLVLFWRYIGESVSCVGIWICFLYSCFAYACDL